jgi:hypothetical protein
MDNAHVLWALEGTGCCGAGLASFLADHGEWVIEIDRPERPRGRSGAKSDPLHAVRAGREALGREHLATHDSAASERRCGCSRSPTPVPLR